MKWISEKKLEYFFAVDFEDPASEGEISGGVSERAELYVFFYWVK
jgi:hypothetical protein